MITPPALWEDPGLRRVIAALTEDARPARLVGGCVRDAVLGASAKDVDVATPLRPEEATRRLRDAGVKVIPTGLAHGTVTAIAHDRSIEVTTLRRDLETDGRHAQVAYTEDWRIDAERRDLTINALYADLDGTIYDFVGGVTDLRAGIVRFVGDPATRIAEDYLRIPRYFRFFARFARVPPDAETLKALSDGMSGVAQLAGERLKTEAGALLSLENPMPGVGLAAAVGYWSQIWSSPGDQDALSRLIAREAAHRLPGDPLRRLAALAGPAVTPELAERLRLSRAETKRFLAIPPSLSAVAATDPAASQLLRRRIGATAARDASLIAAPDGALGAWLKATKAETPDPPISAADLIALGVAPGPQLGRSLAALQSWWDAAEGAPDRSACLARIVECLEKGPLSSK